ncbi:uncharacterized protein [Chlorocebus sabaeus]|uniref:uncharacterized protein n=1 Tax=Chlorocebus sabaeus TaxID=60711 RepID=UPI003BF95A66
MPRDFYLLDLAALHVGPHRVRLLLVHQMGKFLHQCLGESTRSPGQWESVAPQHGGREHTALKLQTPSGGQEGTIGWLGIDFLNRTQKVVTIKEKIDKEDVPRKLLRPSPACDATEHPPATFFPSAHQRWAAGGSSRGRIQLRELRPWPCTPPHPPPLAQQNLPRPRLNPAVRPRVPDSPPAQPHGASSPRKTLSGLRGNFPSREQPVAAPPRLGPAPGAAGRQSRIPKAPCSLRSSGSLATLTYPSQYRRGINRQPPLRPRHPTTGSSESRQNPRRRRCGVLKGPGRLYCIMVPADSLRTGQGHQLLSLEKCEPEHAHKCTQTFAQIQGFKHCSKPIHSHEAAQSSSLERRRASHSLALSPRLPSSSPASWRCTSCPPGSHAALCGWSQLNLNTFHYAVPISTGGEMKAQTPWVASPCFVIFSHGITYTARNIRKKICCSNMLE